MVRAARSARKLMVRHKANTRIRPITAHLEHADYSYRTAGQPNFRTIEQWNGGDLGATDRTGAVAQRL